MVPNDAKYNEFINYVAGIYAQAEESIFEVISRRLAQGIDAPEWATRKLEEIQAVNAEIRKVLEATIAPSREAFIKGIADAYNAGYGTSSSPFQGSNNKQAIAALTKELLDKVSAGFFQILRAADDIYRRTIADAVALAATGATTRAVAASRALATFADAGIKGFRDKRGREWGLAEYTEMATRTAYTRAHADGNVNRYTDEGYDLVYVPTSPEPCPTCDPLENKVYSTGGKSPGYPLLRDAISKGLFHPNCTHRVVPYVRGLTKIPARPPKEERTAKYEERQKQRQIERDIRRWKRREAAALTPEDKSKARAGVKFHQQKMRGFIDDTGRLRDSRRENLGIPKKPKGL